MHPLLLLLLLQLVRHACRARDARACLHAVCPGPSPTQCTCHPRSPWRSGAELQASPLSGSLSPPTGEQLSCRGMPGVVPFVCCFGCACIPRTAAEASVRFVHLRAQQARVAPDRRLTQPAARPAAALLWPHAVCTNAPLPAGQPALCESCLLAQPLACRIKKQLGLEEKK